MLLAIKIYYFLLLDFVPSRIGSYWGKNEEIDLIAVDESN
ncbi:MAG: DUF234 domain-containing protein [Alphaproteobacteria bacterium]|nr:DUF234 domain-containing protein [Alphaproteobacteria bacterium]